MAAILTGALLALSAWLLGVWLMVRTRLHPPRLTPIRALLLLGRAHPDDLGFAYTPVEFQIEYAGRPMALHGSLVTSEQPSDHTVIVLHGFADSSAGAAAWLPLLAGCGVNVLLLDLPAHGESGDGPCTAGWFERDAVSQAIAKFGELHPEASRRITLYGISMGAATALAAACRDNRISAVVADSPFSDFASACELHAKLFGLPGRLFQRPATWIIERRYGISFMEIAPINTLAQAPCPVLLIQSELDQFITPDEILALRQQVMARNDGASREMTIAGASHILGMAKAPDTYASAVREFLAATTSDRR